MWGGRGIGGLGAGWGGEGELAGLMMNPWGGRTIRSPLVESCFALYFPCPWLVRGPSVVETASPSSPLIPSGLNVHGCACLALSMGAEMTVMIFRYNYEPLFLQTLLLS